MTEHDKALRRARDAKYRKNLRAQCFVQYGGKCVDCSDTDFSKLELDHINGGGNKQRAALFHKGRHSSGGYKFYLWLKQHDWPMKDLLCLRCTPCHDKKHGRTPRHV
jgi:hypothetical protein